MKIRHQIERIRTNTRYYGWAASLHLLGIRIARTLIKIERVHFFVLDRLPPHIPIPGPEQVHLATPEEIIQLAQRPDFDLGEFTPEQIEKLYEAGHRCVFNTIGQQVAGYSWMRVDRSEVPKVGISIELASHEGSTYKGFTHPDFRGATLGLHRFAFWYEYLRSHGRSSIICDFSFDNKATLSRVAKLQLRRVGTATQLKIGGFQKLLLEGELRKRSVSFL